MHERQKWVYQADQENWFLMPVFMMGLPYLSQVPSLRGSSGNKFCHMTIIGDMLLFETSENMWSCLFYLEFCICVCYLKSEYCIGVIIVIFSNPIPIQEHELGMITNHLSMSIFFLYFF